MQLLEKTFARLSPLTVIVLLLHTVPSVAFRFASPPTGGSVTQLSSVVSRGGWSEEKASRHLSSRRKLLVGTSTFWLAGLLTSALAGAEDSSRADPICVIGANGRTGSACVQACVDRRIPVVAATRVGDFDMDGLPSALVTSTACDVTKPSTVTAAIQSARAVVFAASASKQGGTPSQVDNEGLVNVAKACIAARVPHLVVVSSGGVSKPDSSVYKFLNLFGGIMKEKITGENTVRELYRGNEVSTYTVIRPGGLTMEPALEKPSLLELNQGDTKSGRISRADLASICIESTFYPNLTGETTFECYNADTAKTLDKVGMSNLMKQTNDDAGPFISGRERQGETWEKIFSGLEKDS